MYVQVYINDVYSLLEHLWSGGYDRYNKLSLNDKDVIFTVLNEYQYDTGIVLSITDINDWLWFEFGSLVQLCNDYGYHLNVRCNNV